jgi:hypothetical protein
MMLRRSKWGHFILQGALNESEKAPTGYNFVASHRNTHTDGFQALGR